MNALQLVDLKDVDGEPRVLDLRVAERLGFAKNYSIRKLISRNEKILEMHGKLIFSTVEKNHSGTRAGRPGKEYWLNESQTICLAFASHAPGAEEFQKEVASVWKAYRRGELVPAGVENGSVIEFLLNEIAELRKSMLALQSRPAATREDQSLRTTHQTALWAVRLAGVERGNGSHAGLSRLVSNRLWMRYKSVPGMVVWNDVGRALFHTDAICEWLNGDAPGGGGALIRDWARRRMARKGGKQLELRLIPKDNG